MTDKTSDRVRALEVIAKSKIPEDMTPSEWDGCNWDFVAEYTSLVLTARKALAAPEADFLSPEEVMQARELAKQNSENAMALEIDGPHPRVTELRALAAPSPAPAPETITDAAFAIGEPVIKSSGYDFPGIIRAVFVTSGGAVRYVVEHATSTGLLHIFNEGQLTAAPRGKGTARAAGTDVTDAEVEAACRAFKEACGHPALDPHRHLMRTALQAAAKARTL